MKTEIAEELKEVMSGHRTVAVIPCSGIGKAFGTVSREAAYELCENLRPADTTLVALSKLVLGEQDAQARVRTNPAVTIDGCKPMCASKLVKLSGGSVVREVSVLEVFRRYKELKPEGIAELNEPGKELARTIADRTEIFTRLQFKPVIPIARGNESREAVEARARRALEAAQKYSLVANSIKSEILMLPEILIMDCLAQN